MYPTQYNAWLNNAMNVCMYVCMSDSWWSDSSGFRASDCRSMGLTKGLQNLGAIAAGQGATTVVLW